MSTWRWRCSDCSRCQNKYRENTFLKKNANLSTRQINQLYSISQTKEIFRKYFKKKFWFKTNSQFPFKYWFNLWFILKLSSKVSLVQTTLVKESSKHEEVNPFMPVALYDKCHKIMFIFYFYFIFLFFVQNRWKVHTNLTHVVFIRFLFRTMTTYILPLLYGI